MAKLTSYIPALINSMQQRAEAVVDDTLQAFAKKLSEEFHGSKSGRIYGTHQASAPGEPPAIYSTELVTSIEPSKPSRFQARMVANAPHAVKLEFGTTKIAPRPFWSVALDAVRPGFEQRVGAILT